MILIHSETIRQGHSDDSNTPTLHPLKCEQLQQESRLIVTVESDPEFQNDISKRINALEQGDSVDAPASLSFASYDDLMAMLTPRVLDLVRQSVGTNPRASTKPTPTAD